MTIALKLAHRDLLAALQAADPPIPVVVIGAQALLHHIPLERDTKDVDLVIVANIEDIRAHLTKLGWTANRLVPRWDHGDARVDVLPGTADVIAAGYVDMGDGRRLSTIGFDLALKHALETFVVGLRVRVASLPSIVVMKMVAWLDRPGERMRDLADIGCAFDLALADDDERRWESPLAQVEFNLQAAHFLGREIRGMAGQAHRVKVDEFLGATRRYAREIGAGGLICEDPLDVAARRLAAFREGFARG